MLIKNNPRNLPSNGGWCSNVRMYLGLYVELEKIPNSFNIIVDIRVGSRGPTQGKNHVKPCPVPEDSGYGRVEVDFSMCGVLRGGALMAI